MAAGGFLVTALVLGTALLDSPAVYAADQNIATAHSDKDLQLAHAGDLAGAESELRAAVHSRRTIPNTCPILPLF